MNSQELLQVIKQRRSIQPNLYTQEEINQDELDMILESANWAPNHKRTEPWRFKVVEGDARKRFGDFIVSIYERNTPVELQSDRKKEDFINKAILSNKIILLCMQTSPILPEWEELAATSMAVQNMWLMSTQLGIGAYWSSPSMINFVQEFTPMAENEKCIGFFYMGKLGELIPEGTRKPIEDKVTYIKE